MTAETKSHVLPHLSPAAAATVQLLTDVDELVHASTTDDLATVERLLVKGVDSNTLSNDMVCLMLAIQSHDVTAGC